MLSTNKVTPVPSKLNITAFQDQYQYLQNIGRGSFGDVEKVRQKFGNRQLRAVKNLPLDPTAEEEKQIEQLKLLKGDHIIQFFGYVVENNELKIIMQYCKGNLRQQINQNKQFRPHLVLGLITQITSAMLILNSKSVMHLDLKPENILYQQNNYYKICDFGCSQIYKSVSKNFSPKTKMMGKNQSSIKIDDRNFGTIFYIAPEVQLNFQKFGKNSCDVWSLGIIVYEIIYKRHPFKIDKNHRASEQDLKKFIQGQLKIQFPPVHQEYPIDLLKKMLEPENEKNTRISWPQIRQYLIKHYKKEWVDFANVEELAKSQILLSIIFGNVIFTIQDNIKGGFGEFWKNNREELKQMKKVLVKLGYGYILKFQRIFEYKLRFKLSGVTLANFEFVKINFHEEIQKLKQMEEFDNEEKIKALQKNLLLLVEELKKKINLDEKSKWQPIQKLSCFVQEVCLLRNLFCKGDLFKRTRQIYALDEFQ